MIVQCEQCRTKFRLDDGKISERGVKVRCAKCRHVFTVQREAAAPETAPFVEASPATPSPPAEDLWAPALETAEATVRMSVETPPEPGVAGFEPEPSVAFDFGEVTTTEPSSGAPAAAPGETAFGDIDFGASVSPSPVAQDESPFNLGQTDAAPADVDFSDLSFGAFGAAAEPAAPSPAEFGEMTMVMPPRHQAQDSPAEPVPDLPAAAQPEPQPVPDTPFGGFDFSAASDANELPPPAPPLETAAPESAPATFEFSPAGTTAPEPSEPPAPTPPPAVEDSFGLADLTFEGDTPSRQTPAPEAAPAAASPAITFAAPEPPQAQETPPLAISSRRRQSPLLSSLIAVVTVLVVGVLGFMTYSHLSDGPGAFKLFDKPRVPAEEGKILVQKISAFYLDKATAGELLVITGEAVNQFTKPRASLQVKASVFAGDGSVLTSKTAYAGNQLTREHLLTMPADKIEATMNNQFGDSLVNLEVQPGKAIPFTIVIVNPPKEGRDFGVEAAGSTVAASK